MQRYVYRRPHDYGLRFRPASPLMFSAVVAGPQTIMVPVAVVETEVNAPTIAIGVGTISVPVAVVETEAIAPSLVLAGIISVPVVVIETATNTPTVIVGAITITATTVIVDIEANAPTVVGGGPTQSVEATSVSLEATITMTKTSLHPSLED